MAQGIVEPSSRENEQKQQRAPVGERARLIQRLLDAAGDLPTFVKDLLATQAVTVVGTEAAAFLIERTGTDEQGNPTAGLKAIAHIRPDESDAQTRAAALKAFESLITRCVVEGKDGAIEVGPANQDNEPQYCLITLLRDGPEMVAVSAVVTRCRNGELARQRLNSMQLVAGYFEFFALRRGAESSKQVAQNHQRVLQLSRAVADADGFLSAAMNLCNELANATAASRVSVGWLKGVQGRTVRVVGHPLAFTFWGLVIGSVLYSLPFAVQPVLAGFRGVAPALLESAALLGAGRWRVLTRVLLPGARASVLAAAVLCFAHTVGEFGVVLMLGGSIPGATRTLSIALYDQVQDGNYAAANAMALSLVAISLAALLLVYSVSRPGRRGEASRA